MGLGGQGLGGRGWADRAWTDRPWAESPELKPFGLQLCSGALNLGLVQPTSRAPEPLKAAFQLAHRLQLAVVVVGPGAAIAVLQAV